MSKGDGCKVLSSTLHSFSRDVFFVSAEYVVVPHLSGVEESRLMEYDAF